MRNHKRVLSICIVILIIFFILWPKPTYKVISQYRSSSPNYSETSISVIIENVWTERQVDRLVQDIIIEHRRINYDVPTNKIILHLFRGKRNYEQWNELKEVVVNIE